MADKDKELSAHFIDCVYKNIRTIYLDDEAWDEFVAILESPPRPCPRLKDLLAKKPIMGRLLNYPS